MIENFSKTNWIWYTRRDRKGTDNAGSLERNDWEGKGEERVRWQIRGTNQVWVGEEEHGWGIARSQGETGKGEEG